MTYLEQIALLIPYPSSLLPKPQEPAYSITLTTFTNSSKMSSGRKRHRKNPYKNPDLVSIPLLLNGLEKQLLDSFLLEELSDCSKPFSMEVYWDLCDGQLCEVEILNPSKPYSATPDSGNWRLVLDLKINRRPVTIPYYLLNMDLAFNKHLKKVVYVVNLPMHSQYSHLFNFDPIYPMINGIQVHDKGH